MSNTIHILPTDGESPIMKDNDGLHFAKKYGFELFNNKNNFMHFPYHVYVCSLEEIREGEWMIDGSGRLRQAQRDLSREEVQNSLCKKVEAATNINLYGIEKIDGNTKAEILFPGYSLAKNIPMEVNFLTELCKRWNEKEHEHILMKQEPLFGVSDTLCIECGKKLDYNQKDTKKVDVEKWVNFKELVAYIEGNEDRDFNLINAPRLLNWVNDYSQALQSTGQYSMEDEDREFLLRLRAYFSEKKTPFEQNAHTFLNKIAKNLTKDSSPKSSIEVDYDKKTKTIIFK